MTADALDQTAVLERCTTYRKAMTAAARGMCLGFKSMHCIEPTAWFVGTSQMGADLFITTEMLGSDPLGSLNRFVQTQLPQAIVISPGLAAFSGNHMTAILHNGQVLHADPNLQHALVFDVVTAWGYGERWGYPIYADGTFQDVLSFIEKPTWLPEYSTIYAVHKGH